MNKAKIIEAMMEASFDYTNGSGAYQKAKSEKAVFMKNLRGKHAAALKALCKELPDALSAYKGNLIMTVHDNSCNYYNQLKQWGNDE